MAVKATPAEKSLRDLAKEREDPKLRKQRLSGVRRAFDDAHLRTFGTPYPFR